MTAYYLSTIFKADKLMVVHAVSALSIRWFFTNFIFKLVAKLYWKSDALIIKGIRNKCSSSDLMCCSFQVIKT